MLDSVELAGKIEKWGISGVSQLVFIIGGSLGLVKWRCFPGPIIS